MLLSSTVYSIAGTEMLISEANNIVRTNVAMSAVDVVDGTIF